MNIHLTILLAALLVAVLVDQRQHRLPNWLTGGLALGGLVVQSSIAGGAGLVEGLAGMAIGLGIFLVPYLLRSLAAGDVKLMAAVGVWLGPSQVLGAAALTLIVGAGIGGLVLGYRCWRHSASAEQVLTSRFPYAAAIAIGVSTSLVIKETSWML